MTEVHCLFHNYSDWDAACNQTLVGIFHTHSEAETALEKLIEHGTRLANESRVFDDRFRACAARFAQCKQGIGSPEHALILKDHTLVVEDQRAWRITNFGVDQNDIPDVCIQNYTIERVQVGSIRNRSQVQ